MPEDADHVAAIGDNRKMLIFKRAELPEMARGKGVRLQKFKDGGLADAKLFKLKEGLSWIDSSGRNWNVTDLKEWIGERAQAGTVAAEGLPEDQQVWVKMPRSTAKLDREQDQLSGLTMDQHVNLRRQTLSVLKALFECSRDSLLGADISRSTGLASGSLLFLLGRLEKAGWLRSEWEAGDPSVLGRPRRRLYSVTAAGARNSRQIANQLTPSAVRLSWIS